MIRCLIVEDFQPDVDKLLYFVEAHQMPRMAVAAICDNAEDIFSLLKEHEPDLIFLDRELASDLNGLEYLNILKNLRFGLPPVVITTSTPPKASEVSKLQTLGKVLVLEKPYDESEFRETIAALHPLPINSGSAISINPTKRGILRLPDQFIQILEDDNENSHLKRMVNLKDVLFVSSMGAKKVIQLNDGRQVFLWDSFAVFTNYGFKSVHRTFFVNFEARNAEFAFDVLHRQLVITHNGRSYRLDVRPNFSAQQLLDYLNNAA
jgi:DNA-binding LytR/AlgR family response regulator